MNAKSWKQRVAAMRREREEFVRSPGDRPKFKVNLFVSKAYEDETGAWYVEGVASGTRVDLQGERLMPEAIAGMAQQINSGMIPFCTTHWDSDWNNEFGYMKEGSVDAEDQLFVRVWLDREHPESKKLWRKLNGVPDQGIPPRKLGMSIGGWIEDGRWETVDGKSVYSIYRIKLVHNVPTSMPAYPDASISGFYARDARYAQDWVGAICKSVRQWQASADNPGAHGAGASCPQCGSAHGAGNEGGDDPMKTKANGGHPAQRTGSDPDDSTARRLTAKAGEDAEDDAGAGGGDPPQQPEQDDEVKGSWIKATDITEEMEVWCRTPKVASASPAPGGGDVITKDQFEKLEGKVDALAETTKALIETLKARETPAPGKDPEADDDAKKKTPDAQTVGKGLHQHPNDPAIGQARTQTGGAAAPKNAIERIKETEAYQKASRLERYEMLQDAMSSQLQQTRQAQ